MKPSPSSTSGLSPIERFAQLADLRALAVVCDERHSKTVTRQWAARFERREQLVARRLEAKFGQEAVRKAREVSVFGCSGGTAETHRKNYDAVLKGLETDRSF